jgi:lipid II:glycine glycyltransferase (peptidoglycan interpeptide bridge formation enzyme)
MTSTCFTKLLSTTGERDAFGIHSRDYYQRTTSCFPQRRLRLLVAELMGGPWLVDGLCPGPRAWYLYGASSDLYRELMPTYLISGRRCAGQSQGLPGI